MKHAAILFLLTLLPALAQRGFVTLPANTVLAHHDMLLWSGSAWVPLGKGTNGQTLSINGTNVVWNTPAPGGGGGGSGTLESVNAETTIAGLGFAGGPITNFGTLSLTGVVAVASGGTGATNPAAARSSLGILSSRWLTGFGSPTNYSEGAGTHYVNLDTYQVWLQTDANTFETIPFFVMGEGVYSYLSQHNIFSGANQFTQLLTLGAGISGDGQGLTNLSGSEIRSGTVAAARIDSGIARVMSPSTSTWSGLTLISDASAARHFRVRLTNTTAATLAVPTNAPDGARVLWEIQQDATGSRLLALGTGFKTGAHVTGLYLSTNAHAVDFAGAIFNAASNVWFLLSAPGGYR